MRSIYLIGSNHTYQFGSRPFCDVSENALAEYRSFILASIAQYQIVGIAEEMNVYCLKKRLIQGGSVAFDLATELGLAHRYCEADPEIQKARGIKTSGQREGYWIQQLNFFNVFPAIFLLGSDHTKSFTSLLKQSGFQPIVLMDDWKSSFPPLG